MDLLARLSSSLPLALAVLGALVLVIAVLLAVVVLRARRRKQETAEEAGGPPAPATAPAGAITVDLTGLDEIARLESSFRRGFRRFSREAGASGRYGVPWVLALGEEGAGLSGLLARAGLDLVAEPPDDATRHGCAWWLCERGALIEGSARYLLAAGGRRAEEAGWHRLLHLLEEHRPERPLDGLLVAVDVAALAPQGGPAHDPVAAAERKGAAIGARVKQLQRRLGLRLPLYVALTGCERLPGAAAFLEALPGTAHGEMLGWSSPYAVETSYVSGWVDEAFDGLRRDLRLAQLELYAEGERPADPDAAFLFPDEIATLREPVRLLLDRALGESAYGDGIPLRGIYFCAAEPPSAGRPEGAARALFLADLVQKKALAERGLARPAAGVRRERGRAVKVARAAVLGGTALLAAGVTAAWLRLDAAARGFQTFFEGEARQVAEVRAQRGRADSAVAEQRVQTVFQDMSTLDARWFASLFLPSSWPFASDADERIAAGFGRIYAEVVFAALKAELERRAQELTAPPPYVPPAERAAEAGAPAGRTPELADLDRYVAACGELERNIGHYDRLGESGRGSLENLDALVRYLFGEPLPRGFFGRSQLYRTALERVSVAPLTPESFAPAARAKARILAARFTDAVFSGGPAARSLGDLSGELAALSRQSEASTEELRAVAAAVAGARRALAGHDLAWTFSLPFNPGTAFDRVLARMSASRLLGPDAAADVRRASENAQHDFRAALLAYDSPFDRPLVDLPPEGGVHLAEELTVLESALASLVKQEFMAPGDLRWFTPTIGRGLRLAWDTGPLEQAVALYEPYRTFVDAGLPKFPLSLRQPLREAAAARLAERMGDLVAEAQRFVAAGEPVAPDQAEEELRAEVDDLTAAAKPLTQIADDFDRLGFAGAEQALGDLLDAEALGILRGADRLLEEEDLYTPRGGSFAWWDGSRPLAARAFGLRDPAELPAWVEERRDRVTYLARQLAEPALRVSGRNRARRGGEMRALAARWEGILTALSRYDAKRPGNSLASLEGLLLGDLQEADRASCARAGQAGVVAESAAGDYFARAESGLKRSLVERCRALTGGDAAAAYARLRRFFNRRLAGRFPFAEGPPAGSQESEADPESVRALFEVFDRNAPAVEAVTDPAVLGANGAEALRFVARLRRAREFFAPWLAAETKPRLPTWALDADFRVNRDHEEGGNEVLRWELAAGGRSVSRRAAERRLAWTAGEPVTVSLVWAKDAPVLPAPEPGVAATAPSSSGKEAAAPAEAAGDAERTATFSYAGRWALFALLGEHRAPPEELTGGADSRPHTLRFEVPTRAVADGKPGRARVYLRLALFSPDGKRELSFPPLPARAPDPGAGAARAAANRDEEGSGGP